MQTFEKVVGPNEALSVQFRLDCVEIVRATGTLTLTLVGGGTVKGRQGDTLRFDKEIEGFSAVSTAAGDNVEIRVARGLTFSGANFGSGGGGGNVTIVAPLPLPIDGGNPNNVNVNIAALTSPYPWPSKTMGWHPEAGQFQDILTSSAGKSLSIATEKESYGFLFNSPTIIGGRSFQGAYIGIGASTAGAIANFNAPIFDENGNFFSNGILPFDGNLGKGFYVYIGGAMSINVAAVVGTLSFSMISMPVWNLPNPGEHGELVARYNGALTAGIPQNIIPAPVSVNLIRVKRILFSLASAATAGFQDTAAVSLGLRGIGVLSGDFNAKPVFDVPAGLGLDFVSSVNQADASISVYYTLGA